MKYLSRMMWLAALTAAIGITGCEKSEAEPQSQAGAPEAQAAASIPAPEVITTKSGVEMVRLPGGTFTMGADSGSPDEKPPHQVTVAPFLMDRYEVQQAHYESTMGYNPSAFPGKDRPVDQVRWFEAAEYCNERSRREGLEPCYDEETWTCDFTKNGYRLPTEAEWEYAARAGSNGKWFFGNQASDLTRHVWYKDNTTKKTQPVGTSQPNAFGLHDMLGNLWEWTNDYYDAGYYQNSPSDNPRGPETGSKRVLRGGSWNSEADEVSVTVRKNDDPANSDICLGYNTYGFRVVRAAE